MTLQDLEKKLGELEHNLLVLISRQDSCNTRHAYSIMNAESEMSHVVGRVANINDVTGIAFVTLAEDGAIDDVTCGEHMDVFAAWEEVQHYTVGHIRRYRGKLYRCLTEHDSNSSWTPDVSPSLWVNISDPAEEWPAWSQPVGSTDSYPLGSKVSHNDKHWVSDYDNNTWEPGTYGWSEVVEQSEE